MDDKNIVELYFARSEEAIEQTWVKYGRYIHFIANNILCDAHDADECVSDTLLGAWSSIPPNRPKVLSTFIGKIARNLAINRFKKKTALKRDGGAVLVLDELSEIITSDSEGEQTLAEGIELRDAINVFLALQKSAWRIVFVQRYWYSMSIKDIAIENELTEVNTKLILHRMRDKLRIFLEERGIKV